MLLLLWGCAGEPVRETVTTTEILAACGDGVVDTTEGCDDGPANSDTAPGACRADCRPPACGDRVVDGGEGCDDGALRGGDGCDPACQPEAGSPEIEPNDDAADPRADGDAISGSLPPGDADCFSLDLPACGAVRADQTGGCGLGLALSLYDPDGSQVAAGSVGPDGCASLDPAREPGARWVAPGAWTVCARSLTGADLPGYTLALAAVDPISAGLPATGGDLDSDAIPDSCDSDIDQDGVENALDNCPEVSNGPATPAPTLAADGYVLSWLVAGPFITGVSTGTCRPSEDLFVGEDAPLAVTPGDPVGDGSSGLSWQVEDTTTGHLDLLNCCGAVAAPREAYALAYLYSAEARDLTLSLGADDGVFAWWNEALVVDVSSCQGVNRDQFQATVTAVAGWNRLLLKVYDQGGGWGLAARLLDGDAPVTDLQPSLRPGEAWTPDQSDSDGDGIGDVCDK